MALFGIVFLSLPGVGEPFGVSALSSRSEPIDGTLFERMMPQITGVDLSLEFPKAARFDLLTDQTSGNGVAIGDVDDDGRPDLYFTGYNQGNRLYRNLGDWRFEDVTEASRVSGEGRWCGGAGFVDIDNDGDLDLFVCVYGAPNLLYINRGNGVFDERAQSFGLDYAGASVMMAFEDYDRDGDLDVYLVTHRLKDRRRHLLPKSTREAVDRGILRIDQQARRASVRPEYRDYFELMDKGEGRVELIIAGQQDRLFRNDGGNRFIDVSDAAGIRGAGIGLAAMWWDYNQDGWPDLYVSNDYKGADQLYRNEGDGTFSEQARQSLPHVPWFSMGTDAADVNNDGFIDFFASDMSGRDHFSQKMGMGEMGKNRWFLIRSNPQQYMRNALYLGTGTERPLEGAYLAGLANTDWTWSPKFGDLDLDGRVDLFVSNGMSRDFMNSDLSATIRSRDDVKWRQTPVLKQPNLAFRNLGDLKFESVAPQWGLDQTSATYGVALSDLDRDGDLDVVCSSFDEPVSLYRNRSREGAGMLLRLEGTESNRWGIGARVFFEHEGIRQTRVLRASQGFMSANEPLVHFGLQTGNRIKQVNIIWPSGVNQVLKNVPVDRLVTIREGETVEGEQASVGLSRRTWFSDAATGIDWRHRERPYDDYQRQPLLPARQSQSGPGIAVGDVDGDGDEDLYLGGAAGQSGTLMLREGTEWVPTRDPFALDTRSEDMGALFFDLEGDGDLDLYVVSGGVEVPPGSSPLKDRLYLNQGDGRFRKAGPERFSQASHSGSVVVCADVDRDGDLDLFVGGRSVPGQYPVAASNQLLLNDDGRLVEVTESLAPGLKSSGIVTAALWSDQDGDGWLDLLVAHHWGPVRVFRNREGQLVDKTDELGLGAASGWWNGIVGGDFDRDGDVDYVVTNLGKNTKYHGTPLHPNVIYYGDVDGSGVSRIVEAKFEGEICYPERGKSCSTAAIPSLVGKFPSFERFALASLQDIYPTQNLDRALRLEVNHLETVLLRNQSGKLTLEPLDGLSQISPGFGVAASDFNADGYPDVVIAQNDYSPQPETGRMDGGVGVLMKGNSGGELEAIWPRESGVSFLGDGKASVIIDLNQDAWPDVVMSQNNGPLRYFENDRSNDDWQSIALRLVGPPGNRDGIGARVRLSGSGVTFPVQEVYGGSGYLGQSSAILFFGIPKTLETFVVKVDWPDGKKSELTGRNDGRRVWSIRHPAP